MQVACDDHVARGIVLPTSAVKWSHSYQDPCRSKQALRQTLKSRYRSGLKQTIGGCTNNRKLHCSINST